MNSAHQEYPELFHDLERLAVRVHGWLHDPDVGTNNSWLDLVQTAIVTRALNQYRATLGLLRTNHWEDALILTRSTFELLLNIEALAGATDAEVAATSFLEFERLQQYLAARAEHTYAVASGRAPKPDPAKIQALDEDARLLFSHFAYKNKKGRWCWWSGWSAKGATVRQMAQNSAAEIRSHQYVLLYSRGSDFVHSSPIAVLAATHLTAAPPTFEEFLAHANQTEERELKYVAALTASFFAGIMLMVGHRLPRFDEDEVRADLTEIVSWIQHANGDEASPFGTQHQL